MTTIACNRNELYGDLQYTSGSHKWKGNSKVFKFKPTPFCEEEFVVGFSGSAGDTVTVKYWFENPETKPPKVGQLMGLVLTKSGNIFMFDNYTKWLEVRDPFSAVGSGSHFALGAMENGATPKEAVKIAMNKDIYTGFGVKGFSLS